jgi:RNA polymerase sigma-70 factor (ECF subfamily)
MEAPHPDPDVQRMLAFGAGDAEAFDQLFERWAGPLLRFLERMVGDVGTAEELVQETFLRVHGARARYEPTARFSTFLYRIATNLALNELKRPRRRATHTSADVAELRSPEPSADRLLAGRRSHRALAEAMDALPERQRIALWLTAAEGCSQREVAEMLETSEKSVKALVHRARVALTARMQGPASERAPESESLVAPQSESLVAPQSESLVAPESESHGADDASHAPPKTRRRST